MKTVYIRQPQAVKVAEPVEENSEQVDAEDSTEVEATAEITPATIEAADYIRDRVLKKTETEEASIFVRGVFQLFVAKTLKPAGREEFKKYTTAEQFHKRLCDNYTYVAVNKGKIVGLINARDFNHISLLFVTLHMQKQGIAKKLLEFVVKRAVKKGYNELTVNASINAVEVYEHLGFTRVSDELEKNGIVHIKMVMPLAV